MQLENTLTTQQTLQRAISYRMLTDHLSIFVLLMCAHLIAVQMRLRVNMGTPLGPDYVAQPLFVFVILGLAAVMSTYVAVWVRRQYHIRRSRRVHYLNLMIATGLTFFSVSAFLPDVSLLQNLYFVLLAILFGLITIWWTPTLPDADEVSTLAFHLQKLYERRTLLRLWTVTNVQARYQQAWLGILWIMLLPLAQSLIMAFVFANILNRGEVGDVPFVSFFLAGVTAWSFFMKGVNKSARSIVGNKGIISKVYFPREILILVDLAEALIDAFFMFVTLIVINLVVGVPLTAYMLFVPLIVVVQCILIIGLMLHISYLGVFVRDTAELVTIVMRLLFYLTPVLYGIAMLPERVQSLLMLNPLASIINAYRDTIIYQQPPDFVSLYYPLVVGVLLMYTGYLSFKSKESILADYV